MTDLLTIAIEGVGSLTSATQADGLMAPTWAPVEVEWTRSRTRPTIFVRASITGVGAISA